MLLSFSSEITRDREGAHWIAQFCNLLKERKEREKKEGKEKTKIKEKYLLIMMMNSKIE